MNDEASLACTVSDEVLEIVAADRYVLSVTPSYCYTGCRTHLTGQMVADVPCESAPVVGLHSPAA
jgi:hypothetical protein